MSDPSSPLSGNDVFMPGVPTYLSETVASTTASDGPFVDTSKVKMHCPQKLDLAENAKVAELFRMLDEKDDKINKQCQLITKMENQLARTQENYARVNCESDKLQTLRKRPRCAYRWDNFSDIYPTIVGLPIRFVSMTTLSDNVISNSNSVLLDGIQEIHPHLILFKFTKLDADVRRSEVTDVLQAMEELAVTYDEKNAKFKEFAKDLEEMTTEMAKLKKRLELHETSEEELKTNTPKLHEKLRDLIYGLNLELAEVGRHLSKVFLYIVNLFDLLLNYPICLKNTAKETPILAGEPTESQSVGTVLQRERIAFLQNSLDNLIKVHKQLLRDNADLYYDIPKVEKRVEASMERRKDLKIVLPESKEQMIPDKRIYHQELERIEEVNWTLGNVQLRTHIS
ncbi:hypothetical protein P879_06323 [Paragonimus westermani]|uniref:Uncharacterized protein n=1 Tax=Paragonimus westermani TaxID=34504 RepID=A0A8T0D385_9TREM|nr:hypothetical protein P879_06323 [Paragonimus westermani]